MKLRKYDRIPVKYRASFSSVSAHGEGMIVDISIGGCRARSAFLTQQDERVGVVIRLPGTENPLYIMRAIVRWTNAQEFGMEFMDMELNDRQRLSKVIATTSDQGN
jgi:hypothetical protein